jgi:hypothetical protein
LPNVFFQKTTGWKPCCHDANLPKMVHPNTICTPPRVTARSYFWKRAFHFTSRLFRQNEGAFFSQFLVKMKRR